jgi:hypothetical protein
MAKSPRDEAEPQTCPPVASRFVVIVSHAPFHWSRETVSEALNRAGSKLKQM